MRSKIPSKDNLKKIGIDIDGDCQYCDSQLETLTICSDSVCFLERFRISFRGCIQTLLTVLCIY